MSFLNWQNVAEYDDDPWGIEDELAPSPPNAADLLVGLNEQQKAAVLHSGSPLLIVAGAGSGKTRVLTHRIAHLIATKRAWPSQILAITFTNKAAAEMRQRVTALIGEEGNRMWVSTFHSACLRILRREYQSLELRSSFSIYDTADTLRLVTMISKEMNLDAKKHPPRGLARKISDLKNELITPSAYENDPALVMDGTNRKLAEFDPVLAGVYRIYQKRLRTANALDFDDIIMETVRLLQTYPAVAEHYRRRFRHILVDEYQDTNHAQYTLVKELVGGPGATGWHGEPPAGELTVVGDADQSIYAFRGATIRNINQFEVDYPDATTILLEQNYRSTQTVLDAANAVISRNPDRKPKNLWTAAGPGAKIVGYTADDEYGEARFIAAEIDRLADNHQIRHSQVAIFYRANAQSRALEEILIRVGIPYRIVGGTRFYERREIKDAVAYLSALANPDDDVNLRRILSVPRRGIGDKAEATVAGYAAAQGISFGAALDRAARIPGITPRTLNPLQKFATQLNTWRSRVAAGASAATVLQAVLDESGLLKELQESSDPQDATRIENLAELVAVATEFHELNPEAPLADFLERIALVADSDQIPDAEPDDSAPVETGVVTLMTLHTAKGLEFPVVFLTGMEDGTFPHIRSMYNEGELAEERRLAYVGLTRAQERLYVTRSAVRSAWGASSSMPESRFLSDIPEDLIDWQRRASATEEIRGGDSGWGSGSSLFGSGGHWGSSRTTTSARPSSGVSGATFKGRTGLKSRATDPRRPATSSASVASDKGSEASIPDFAIGERVVHDSYGLGKVLGFEGTGRNAVAQVEFGSAGTKRLVLRYARLQKL
jgi:DNA helicase-2/ATP-dependent DNA helicase PcrA